MRCIVPSDSRTQTTARVQYGIGREALVRAVDGALAHGLTQEEIMALVQDRAQGAADQDASARVYTELPDGLIDLPSAAEKYGLHRQVLRDWVLKGRLQIYGRLRGSAPGGGFLVLKESDVQTQIAAPKSKGGRPRKGPE